MATYTTSDGGLILNSEQADFICSVRSELDLIYDEAQARRQAAIEGRRSDINTLRAAVCKSKHDAGKLSDFDLLRFVLARKTIEESESMVLKALEWNATYTFSCCSPAKLRPKHIWSEIKHPGKIEFTYNKERTPCFIARPSRHDKHHRDLEKTNALSVYTMEQAIRMLHPSQDKVCVLFDTRKVSMKSFDIEFLKFTTIMLLMYYPNRLDRAFVYGCPAVMKMMWKAFSPMLPEETRSKFVFIDDVSKYFEAKCLPSDMGGDGSCVFVQNIEHENTTGLVRIESLAALQTEIAVVVHSEDLEKKRSKKDKRLINANPGSCIVVINYCNHAVVVVLKTEKDTVSQVTISSGQTGRLRCGVPHGSICDLLLSTSLGARHCGDAGIESASVESETSTVPSVPGSPSVFDTAPKSLKPSLIGRLLLGGKKKSAGSDRSSSPASTVFNSCFSGSGASSVNNDESDSVNGWDEEGGAGSSNESSGPSVQICETKASVVLARVRITNETRKS